MAGPIPRYLLPDSATAGPDGELLVGGCNTLDLAAEFGTPLFVYDEDQIRDRCRRAVRAWGDGVAYAAKAFLCKEMARIAHAEGMHIDVATGGELFVALEAGVPADRLVLHGNNKSTAEIRMALERGVHRVVVDSFDEMDRIESLVAAGLPPPEVLLRLTPGIEAHTHEFVQTGHDDTKFGFTVSTGVAAAAVDRARASNAMDLVGVHAHIGSQVFTVDSFAQAARIISRIVSPFGLPELSVGGGLGVPYIEGEEAAGIEDWAAAVTSACREEGVTASVTAEPGRSIVAAAAITLYTVGTIKHLDGIRTYVAVDGGMSDNPRPVLYGSGYETFLPRALDAPRTREIRLVGKHCESGDLLVREGWVPGDVTIGDVVATPVTGAYGHSMGSTYNKVVRPPVVFVRDGEARLVVRRETYEDLTRLDR